VNFGDHDGGTFVGPLTDIVWGDWRARYALFLLVAMVVFGTWTPTGSAIGWFDDDGAPLYCRASYDTPGVPGVDLLTSYVVVSSDNVTLTCRWHTPPSSDYPTARTVDARFGATSLRIEPDPDRPGCATLTGGLAGRVSVDVCADNDRPDVPYADWPLRD
jgi:hypothetical protein